MKNSLLQIYTKTWIQTQILGTVTAASQYNTRNITWHTFSLFRVMNLGKKHMDISYEGLIGEDNDKQKAMSYIKGLLTFAISCHNITVVLLKHKEMIQFSSSGIISSSHGSTRWDSCIIHLHERGYWTQVHQGLYIRFWHCNGEKGDGKDPQQVQYKEQLKETDMELKEYQIEILVFFC